MISPILSGYRTVLVLLHIALVLHSNDVQGNIFVVILRFCMRALGFGGHVADQSSSRLVRKKVVNDGLRASYS